jgi:hypothetical protein
MTLLPPPNEDPTASNKDSLLPWVWMSGPVLCHTLHNPGPQPPEPTGCSSQKDLQG